MVKIQCIGRRRLDISRLEDGNYEVRIVLVRRGGEIILASPIVVPEEFEKIKEVFKV